MPLADHTYGDASYTWKSNECTASHISEIECCGFEEKETVTAQFVVDTPATCETNEKCHLLAIFSISGFEAQSTEENSIEIPGSALGHDFSLPTYTWDNNVCTAERHCVHEGCECLEIENAVGIYVKDADPKCEINENGHYKPTFVNTAFTEQNTAKGSVEKPGTALKHNYGKAEYCWSNDECTATRKCTHEGCDHFESESVKGVYVIDSDATCETNEMGHYIAKFTNIAFTRQTTPLNSVEMPNTALGHKYGNVQYAFVGDTCTGIRTCQNGNCSEYESETIVATFVKDTDATCTTASKGHYVATFTNPIFASQTTAPNSVAFGDPLGHSLVEHAAKEATSTETGNSLYYECSRCGKFFADAQGKVEIAKDSWIIPVKKSGGCGGNLATASGTIVGLISLLGLAITIRKKKEI